MSELFQLTAAQQIRLEVFRRLTVDGRGMYPVLTKEITALSATIIGEPAKALVVDPQAEAKALYGRYLTELPGWAKFVAADYDGKVFAYDAKPSGADDGSGVYANNGEELRVLGLIDRKTDGFVYPVLAL